MSDDLTNHPLYREAAMSDVREALNGLLIALAKSHPEPWPQGIKDAADRANAALSTPPTDVTLRGVLKTLLEHTTHVCGNCRMSAEAALARQPKVLVDEVVALNGNALDINLFVDKATPYSRVRVLVVEEKP